jgi:rare lipoprotein A
LSNLKAEPTTHLMKKLIFIALCLLTLGSTLGQHYNVQSKTGYASYYSVRTNGGTTTASGTPLSDNALTAASCHYPLGSMVRVVNPKNGKSVDVKITDRGPFAASTSGVALRPLRPHPKRVIDLSLAAARRIYSLEIGVIEVKTYKIK